MFFFEWVVPLLIVLFAASALFYVMVRNRTGAGIRSNGRVLLHKRDSDDDSERAD